MSSIEANTFDAAAAVSSIARSRGRARLRLLGRFLSAVENNPACLAGVPVPAVPVIGLTGPPGVGKSTACDALCRHYADQGLNVTVLAIDPSSAVSGGAFLGDRLRQHTHSGPGSVFFRSIATRGALGGLNPAVPAMVDALRMCGADLVIVETVGVGQNETDIAALADTCVVVLAPGSGDAAQAAKAGVLDIADVLVVNQSDREGAASLGSTLRQAVARRVDTADHDVPVLLCSAARGEGLTELIAVLDGRRRHGAGPARAHKGWARERLAVAAATSALWQQLSAGAGVAQILRGVREGERSVADSALLLSAALRYVAQRGEVTPPRNIQ